MTVFTRPGTSKRVTVTNPVTVKTLREAGWKPEPEDKPDKPAPRATKATK